MTVGSFLQFFSEEKLCDHDGTKEVELCNNSRCIACLYSTAPRHDLVQRRRLIVSCSFTPIMQEAIRENRLNIVLQYNDMGNCYDSVAFKLGGGTAIGFPVLISFIWI